MRWVLPLPRTPTTRGPAGRTQQCWSGRLDLIDVKQHKFEASEPNSSSKGCRFGLVALKTGPKPPDE